MLDRLCCKFIYLLDHRQHIRTHVIFFSVCWFFRLLTSFVFRYANRLYSYNMAGHLKFCLTVAAGFFLFQDPLSANQLFGLILTLAGIVAYSYVRSWKLNLEMLTFKLWTVDYAPAPDGSEWQCHKFVNRLTKCLFNKRQFLAPNCLYS